MVPLMMMIVIMMMVDADDDHDYVEDDVDVDADDDPKCSKMISSDGSDCNFMVDQPIQGFFSA